MAGKEQISAEGYFVEYKIRGDGGPFWELTDVGHGYESGAYKNEKRYTL